MKMCNFCQEKYEDKDLKKMRLEPSEEKVFIDIELCKECYDEILRPIQTSMEFIYKEGKV